MKRQICVLLALALITVSTLSFVSAGVSAPYYEERTIVMQPGESRILTFTLSNIEQEDKKVVVSVTSDGEIASVLGSDTYVVKAGQTDVTADVRLKVPSYAPDGQTYTLKASFSEGPASAPTEGGVSLGSAFGVNYKVLVKAMPPETAEKAAAGWDSDTMVLVAVVLVILAILAWMLAKKKKKK